MISNLINSLATWHKQKYVLGIEHQKVIEHVQTEGKLTSRFSFMVIMACSIAILGLLLSSPAVVIGAMLISPLMAPIMSLGFSLCILNLAQMKRALGSLSIGILLAIGISVAIVSVSPLTEATPEILARTQPNLFDLLVAIFSGLAGGYAVIKRKGEAIVGVAIATALMPPLAVVGFGLATNTPNIYQGALMLFMTNLLAIAFSVTLLAKWYGFGAGHSPKHTVWQILLIFGIFGALSIPLGFSLTNIAYQTYVTKIAKSAINQVFHENSKISLFSIHFSKEQPLFIEAVVLTPEYNAKASQLVKSQLIEDIDDEVKVKLDQIIIAKEELKQTQIIISNNQNTLTAPIQSKQVRLSRYEEINNALKQAVFFPVRLIQVEADSNQAFIYPKNIKGLSLTLLRQFEHSLMEKFPDWHISIVPPVQALPYIYFPRGKAIPIPESEETLTDILWALSNWETKEVVVIGHASTFKEFEQFDNISLAYKRASNIVEKIEQAGIKAKAKTDYQAGKQKQEELNFGINNFHRVEIRLEQPIETIIQKQTILKNSKTPQKTAEEIKTTKENISENNPLASSTEEKTTTLVEPASEAENKAISAAEKTEEDVRVPENNETLTTEIKE